VTAHQAFHPIATMCRVLEVSPSGYYAWHKRPLSTRARADLELTAQIEAIHRDSRWTYPTGHRGFTRSWPRKGYPSAGSGWPA
jgi:hypothetical protein